MSRISGWQQVADVARQLADVYIPLAKSYLAAEAELSDCIDAENAAWTHGGGGEMASFMADRQRHTAEALETKCGSYVGIIEELAEACDRLRVTFTRCFVVSPLLFPWHKRDVAAVDESYFELQRIEAEARATLSPQESNRANRSAEDCRRVKRQCLELAQLKTCLQERSELARTVVMHHIRVNELQLIQAGETPDCLSILCGDEPLRWTGDTYAGLLLNETYSPWPTDSDYAIGLHNDTSRERTIWSEYIHRCKEHRLQTAEVLNLVRQSLRILPCEHFDDVREPLVLRWSTRLFGLLSDIEKCTLIRDAESPHVISFGEREVILTFINNAWLDSLCGKKLWAWPWDVLVEKLADFEREAVAIADRIENVQHVSRVSSSAPEEVLTTSDTAKAQEKRGGKKRRLNANARMLELLQKDATLAGLNCVEWAKLLTCHRARIVETETWKSLERERLRVQASQMNDRRRKPKGSDFRRDD